MAIAYLSDSTPTGDLAGQLFKGIELKGVAAIGAMFPGHAQEPGSLPFAGGRREAPSIPLGTGPLDIGKLRVHDPAGMAPAEPQQLVF